VKVKDELTGLNSKQMMAGAAGLHRENVDMTRTHLQHLIAVIKKNRMARINGQAARTWTRNRGDGGRIVIGERITHSPATSRA
jgi:hypothetical protein